MKNEKGRERKLEEERTSEPEREKIGSKGSGRDYTKLDRSISRANAKLDRASIRRKGNRLYLRVTLPDREGNGQKKEREISTGCIATDEGLKVAIAKATEIVTALMWERDPWGVIDGWDSQSEKERKERKRKERSSLEGTVAGLIREGKKIRIFEVLKLYEQEYFAIRPRTPTTERSYKTSRQAYFKLLPPEGFLDFKTLRDTLITKTKPDTCSRSICYQAFNALVSFAKLDIDLSPYRGNYKPKLRNIPTPEEVERAIDNLPDRWQFVLGHIATFGLRDHEVFFLHLERLTENPPVLVIDEKGVDRTKTGYRISLPLFPEWVERWELTRYRFPNFRYDLEKVSNSQLGARIAINLYNNHGEFPYTVYQLRDFYAVYCGVLGVPDHLAIAMMGHSTTTHYQHYKSHTDERRLIEGFVNWRDGREIEKRDSRKNPRGD
jgi:hypothetical protein